ncbi:MAG: OmpA family protein [Bacteroidia bacterium]
MRKFSFIFFSLIISFSALAQKDIFTGTKNSKSEKYFGEAIKLYTSMDYIHALQSLLKATKEDPNFIDAWLLIADIRELNEQFKEAIDIYKNVIGINRKFQIPYYKLAASANKAGDYEQALNYINSYDSLQGYQIEKWKVEKIKSTAIFSIEAKKHPVVFEPKNLGSNINTAMDEYCPGVTIDDQTMIFTRKDHDRDENFYISTRLKDGWSLAQNMGPPINTELNEGMISISSDGQYVFFTECNRPEGEGSCDLYFSSLDGNTWKSPRNLGFPINTRGWESQPSVSFDGKTLYFSSARDGGFGGYDLWYSTYNKGHWSPPINMGPNINTSGYEECPFICKDDKTLFFSSDGHAGMGGVDIYMSRRQPDGRWGKAVNLGYPINSNSEERGIVVSSNGKDAYIYANRPEGKGGLDIYSFVLPENLRANPTGYLKGIIYDSRTLKKLRASVELIDLETGKPYIITASNKATGVYIACLQGNKNYALNVSCDGYLFYSENFALKEQSAVEPLTLNVPLNPILAGEKTILKNIFFDVDQFTLRDESKVELEKLIGFMKNNPNVRIEIGGHTDNTGDKARNSILSANRAKEVYNYLIRNGIEEFRLSFKGYADSQPVGDNKTEPGRQKNRRTEFKITSL